MTLARANGQNKAMMSSKEITRKTREFLAIAIFLDLLCTLFGRKNKRLALKLL